MKTLVMILCSFVLLHISQAQDTENKASKTESVPKTDSTTEKIGLEQLRVKSEMDDFKDPFKKGDLDKLLAELGSDNFKIRRDALNKSKALPSEKKLGLYKKLKSSDDPEFRRVAGILAASIMGAVVAYKKYPLLIGLAEGSKAAQDSQREAAEKMPLEIKLNKSGIVFRLIPAGKFTMGRPKIVEPGMRDVSEGQKQAEVTKAFYMGKFEVTQEQWEKVMGSNPSHFKKIGKDAPVEMVSWDDCQVFIKKLSALEGLANNLKLSLPSEIKWEYACRAGTQTAYYTGDTEADLVRAGWPGYGKGKDSNKTTHEVGQKLCNAFGLYDMHGNILEWCNDSLSENDDRCRINRGGDFGGRRSCGSAAEGRSGNRSSSYYSHLGLRLVLSQSVKK